MNKWLWIVSLSLIVGSGIGFLIWKYKYQNNFQTSNFKLQTKEENKFEVVGFLPTWMIEKTKMYGSEITQLIFSGIEVNKDGSLVWDLQSKKINNENYIAIKDNVKKTGGKNLISIKLFTDKNMDILLADSDAKQKLYAEVKAIVDAGNFDGVNVDFEYMSDPIRILDSDMMEMFGEMKNSGWGEVNVDVFANTIIKGDEERLRKLSETVDGIIVMSYDFHRPGSDFAGPVAPLMAEEGQRSIAEIINRINIGNLNKEKFILAYPLYGYQWETTTGEMNSVTMANGYGVTILYKEGIGYTGGVFDDVSKSPWYAWTEKEKKYKVESYKVKKKTYKRSVPYYIDQWHQAYLENEESLKIKINAVKQEKLGGTGFWALGYEGKESNLIEKLVTGN